MVEVPGPLTHKSVEAVTDLGTLNTEVFYFQPNPDTSAQSGLFFFQVSYCDFPKTALHADSVELLEEFFTQTVAAAAESVGGEVRYADTDESLGYPGYRWRIDYLDGEVAIRTRAVIVDNRYYAWQVVTGTPFSLSSETGRFLESFRILNQ